MSAEFKPGDVAIVTTRSGREYRAVYTLAPGIDYFWKALGNERLRGSLEDPDVDARPLVVIDPEDPEQVARLWGAYERDENYTAGPDGMQAAVRSLITPPKPDEPTGLGAVVEDADGEVWVFISNQPPAIECWRHVGSDVWCDYADITAVRVLSEGVTP